MTSLMPHELEEDRAPRGRAHVERDAPLVAVGDAKGRRAGRAPRRRRGHGQLHHDDVGAELRQDGRGHRAREPLREVEDADSGERARMPTARRRRRRDRASTRGRAAMAAERRRAPRPCARRAGAPPPGSGPAVRDSFGTGAGAMKSRPDSDESDSRSPRARTCSSATMSSTERIAVPVTPHGEEARLDLGEIVPGDPGGHERVGVGAVLEPRGGRGEARILRRIGRLDGLAQAHERLVAGAGHRDPSAVAGRIDIGGDHGRRLGAHARGHGAGPVVLDDDLLLHAQADLVEPEVDDLPAAAAARVEDRHQEASWRRGCPSSSPGAAAATGIGGRSGKPVVNCTPEKACAMRSSPRSPASGPVCPNGEMRRMARRGLRRAARPGDRPAASSRPGPRSSTSASADARSGASQPPGSEVGELGPHRVLAAVLGLKVERGLPGMPGPSVPQR